MMKDDKTQQTKSAKANANIQDALGTVHDLMKMFKAELSSSASKLWLMYNDMAGVLLRYIQSECPSRWDDHLIEAQICFHIWYLLVIEAMQLVSLII